MVAGAGRIGITAMLCALMSCASEPPPPQPVFASVAKSAPLHFQYQLIDGKGWLGAETLHGRPTVIGFLTTYDLASQAEARFLNGILQRHAGKIQVAAVVLEGVDNRPLVIAFRDGLGLGFPVAMADATLISGRGPFGDVHAVPAIVLLDGEGRLVWKKVGLAREEEIENALREL
jgi:thiol-disulfide isomerase/thioredoxin